MKNNRRSKTKHSSTRRFFEEGRKIPGYSLVDFLHGYVYSRWTYFYISTGVGRSFPARVAAKFSSLLKTRSGDTSKPQIPDRSDGRGTVKEVHDLNAPLEFADTYHGKVVPLDAARQLVMVNEPVSLPALEHIIPYRKARDIVLQNPDHIVALDCPCRMARENPCLPLDVCLIVGEPFTSIVVDHHPNHTRWITPDEAVSIIKAEDERGHVHHAFFKDAMLGRFYAICNCCSCCCGALQAHLHGTPMLASSGYIAEVDEEACLSCGSCEAACQFGAISMGETCTVVDYYRCMGCGVCVSHCDAGALSLFRAPEKGAPLEIQTLIESIT